MSMTIILRRASVPVIVGRATIAADLSTVTATGMGTGTGTGTRLDGATATVDGTC